MPSSGEAAVCTITEINTAEKKQKSQNKNLDRVKREMIEAAPEEGGAAGGLTTTELRQMVSGGNELKAQAQRELLTDGGPLVRIDGLIYRRKRVQDTHEWGDQ